METNAMEKMKKILLSLCILGGLITVSLSQNVYAAPEVSTLSPSEQQSIYRDIKKVTTYKDLPKELKALIKPETITGMSSNQEDPVNDDLIILYQDKEDGILIHFDNEGEKRVYARRSKATAKDVAEPVPAPNPNANHFPLPAPLIAALKKEGTWEKMELIGKILNENLEISLQVPAFNISKAKKGEYTGKVLDGPVFTFKKIEAVTQNMNPTELALREKLGFAFRSITDLPNLTLSSSGTDCTGWNYVEPKSETPGQNSFLAPRITSRTIVYNAFFNELGMAGEFHSILLHAKDNYYKELQENFHAMMRENGVEVGADLSKMKGQSAEKMALVVYGNICDNYLNNLNKTITKLYDAKPKSSSYSLAPVLGKPNYKPPVQKKDKRTTAITPSIILNYSNTRTA